MIFEACDRTKGGKVLFQCCLLQGRNVFDLKRDQFKNISNGKHLQHSWTYLVFIVSDSQHQDNFDVVFGTNESNESIESNYAKYLPILAKISADLSISISQRGHSLMLVTPTLFKLGIEPRQT